jgi:hypothetical protein
MPVCYGCLQPFGEAAQAATPQTVPPSVTALPLFAIGGAEADEFPVEEPSELCLGRAQSLQPARFHVAVSGLFGYDIYLDKEEGAQLTIGCARDNNIVLPHTEARRHLLRLYYAQAQVWVEDRGSTQQALIEGIPLTGTRCLKPGAVLEAGGARIEFVED